MLLGTGKGLVPQEDIDRIKKKYNLPMLWTEPTWGKDQVVFIPISRELYIRIARKCLENMLSGMPPPVVEVYETIFDECVVWPKLTPDEKEGLTGGLIHSVARQIELSSGFVDFDIFGNIRGKSSVVVNLSNAQHWDRPSDDEIGELIEKSIFPLAKVRIENYNFICKPLTRGEVLKAQAAEDMSLEYCKYSVIWPEKVDWNTLPAGYIEDLYDNIRGLSGYNNSKEVSVQLLK